MNVILQTYMYVHPGLPCYGKAKRCESGEGIRESYGPRSQIAQAQRPRYDTRAKVADVAFLKFKHEHLLYTIGDKIALNHGDSFMILIFTRGI